ncbi:unnamed protein product [Dracunculus medinensis]|uniref:EGF-like domain-containing protein n=1 Tax=Dracunculus medinensis TaxID=318479 RepID=A0A0N4UAR0_DRAME|nr:unnamed protein product [Dracunculus medinensis]
MHFFEGHCRCQDRFEGVFCEREPCLNGGRRAKGFLNNKCYCPYGLTGERCEKVTHCIEGKGTLIDGKCRCEDRWSGLFCHLRTCYNGVTVGGGDETFCLCDIGYTGPFCDSPIVCIHGTITSENRCICEERWDGNDCNKCAANYQYENGLCKSVVTETSLIINGKKSVILWPLIAVGVGAIALIVLSAFVFVYFIKNHHAKSSLPNSESGTDV